MTALRIERTGPASVRVAGPIGFTNGGEAVRRTDEIFDGSPAIRVDLAGLERADSATLGVLLIWAASAAVRRVAISFANAPDGLRKLAHLCDAEPLLGWS